MDAAAAAWGLLPLSQPSSSDPSTQFSGVQAPGRTGTLDRGGALRKGKRPGSPSVTQRGAALASRATASHGTKPSALSLAGEEKNLAPASLGHIPAVRAGS